MPKAEPPDRSVPLDVVVAGHLCLDIIPTFGPALDWQGLLRPGSLAEIGAAEVRLGGAVANAGIALERMGLRTHWLARTGDDSLASLVRHEVAAIDERLVESLCGTPGDRSSYTIVISAPDRDRAFWHFPGANQHFEPNELLAAPPGARAIHFGYPPILPRTYANGGVAVADALRRLRRRGMIVSLDMAMPDPQGPAARCDWRAWLARVLPHVDLFSPSLEETLLMLRPISAAADAANRHDSPPTLDDVSALADELVALGARIVALKLGADGLLVRSADAARGVTDSPAWRSRQVYSPCCRVEVEGTTAAGDATSAGLLAGLLKELSPEQTVELGVAAGASCVAGPRGPSSVETVDRLLEYPRRFGAAGSRFSLAGWSPTGHEIALTGPRDRHYNL